MSEPPAQSEEHPQQACSICLEDECRDAVETECHHHFCRVCIHHWIQQDATCPNCRAALSPAWQAREIDNHVIEVPDEARREAIEHGIDQRLIQFATSVAWGSIRDAATLRARDRAQHDRSARPTIRDYLGTISAVGRAAMNPTEITSDQWVAAVGIVGRRAVINMVIPPIAQAPVLIVPAAPVLAPVHPFIRRPVVINPLPPSVPNPFWGYVKLLSIAAGLVALVVWRSRTLSQIQPL